MVAQAIWLSSTQLQSTGVTSRFFDCSSMSGALAVLSRIFQTLFENRVTKIQMKDGSHVDDRANHLKGTEKIV